MDADDVAQEALLLAYERLRSFRGEASFKTWLLTITWHQAINRRRSLTRWLKRSPPAGARNDREPGDPEMVSTADSPEDTVAVRELRRAIAEEIRRLSA